MNKPVYKSMVQKKAASQKAFAVLLDPDKVAEQDLGTLLDLSIAAKVDYFFVGGSLVVSHQLSDVVQYIKKNCSIPVILFPGSPSQVCADADALLYLSVISGRNPELLIGQHVISAPAVKKSGLEILPTGYMLIDGGLPTTVSYISNTHPIPSNKNEIAICTAMAGEMLGMQLIYMDAGSGAQKPVSEAMINRVSQVIDIPLIIGGGITEPEKAYLNCKAGADVVVVGNAIEKSIGLITEIGSAVHSVGKPLNI